MNMEKRYRTEEVKDTKFSTDILNTSLATHSLLVSYAAPRLLNTCWALKLGAIILIHGLLSKCADCDKENVYNMKTINA